MRVNLRKSIAVVATALTLAAGVAATSEPAAAAGQVYWHHGGYYGGHWRNGWWGPAIGLGILGGLVAGAAIANANNANSAPAPEPYYGPDADPGPGPYGRSCWQPRPTYDAWGHYVGTRTVNVCY